MDVPALKMFMESPYNKMADVKMYLFFAQVSLFALIVILIMTILSTLIQNFWCRYCCPYGALLGIGSLLSPFKVTRNLSSCIDCELCSQECPANIQVHTLTRVWSDECSGCYACIEACPVKDTLQMKSGKSNTSISSWVFGLLLAGIFTAITGFAMLTGHWRNSISSGEYLQRIKNIDSPLYQHNRGKVPSYKDNE
jgi:polyferredoxin